MKVIVKKEELLKSLKKVQGISEKRTTMPILNNILIESKEKIIIKATNLDNSIISKCEGEIHEVGSICLPSKKFFEIVKNLPSDNIAITKEEKNILIKSGKTSFRLFFQPSEDFPAIKVPSDNKKNIIDRAEFIKALNKVEYAIYPDESRLSLNGVYIHKLENKIRFVSSDSYRLCYYEFPFSDEIENMLISKKAVAEIIKVFSTEKDEKISISTSDNFAAFEVEDTVFITRLREVKFPNYTEVIPYNNPYKSYIDKNNILESLHRLLVIAEESTKGVLFSFKQELISIKGANIELGEGEDEIDHIYEGESMDIGFNAQYLIEAVSNIEAEKIEIALKDSAKAVLISGDENYKAVVMPVKI